MKLLFRVLFASSLFVISCTSYGQESLASAASDTVFVLSGDTLFLNGEPALYLGQKLITGTATGANGWYRSITFKSSNSWPLLLWHGMETENNPGYQYDSQLRTNDKVREYLVTGTIMTVKKLRREGNQRRGYWYTATLKNDAVSAALFRTNVQMALSSKELIIQRNTK